MISPCFKCRMRRLPGASTSSRGASGIVVRALALLLAQLAAAPVVSETIETAEHRPIDLATFECRDISRSTVLQRVCYDRAQQALVVAVNGAYDRYCGVPVDTVERLLGAPSMGQFFNQNIKRQVNAGRYACPARERIQRS